MSFKQFWNHISRRRSHSTQPPHCQRQARPRLECLEDRTVPSTWYVSDTGVDPAPGVGVTGATGGPAAPFRSIQYAINTAATGGDSILVATGTYTHGDDPSAYSQFTSGVNALGNSAVAIVFNKDVRILGGYNSANWSAAPTTNPAATVIDGGNSVQGVLVVGILTSQPAAAIDLEDFTIQHGLASFNTISGDTNAFGGGIWVDERGQQLVNVQQSFSNLIIQNNTAQGENVANGAGGSGAGGGMDLSFVANAQLNTVTFQSNQALGGSGSTFAGEGGGGGLHLDGGSTATGTNVAFNDNAATGGGGVGVSDGLGGAASLQAPGTSTLTLYNSSATGNTATGGFSSSTTDGTVAGNATGGGFEAESSVLNLTNCNVTDNIAQGGTGPTGGASLGGGIGTDSSTVNLFQVSVIGNKSLGGVSSTAATDPNGKQGAPGGGGISMYASPTSFSATMNDTVIADNVAEFASNTSPNTSDSAGGGGAGLWVGSPNGQTATVTVTQSTIANNTLGTNTPFGSGVLLLNNTTATIQYSIIANNSNGISGNNPSYGALQAFVSTTANLTQDLFANNTPNDISTSDPGGTNGTINGYNGALSFASAGFISPGAPNENYQLLSTSPAISQATGSTSTVDRAGNPRVGTPDIGAYQYQPPSIQFSAAQFDYFQSAGTATVTLTRTGDTSATSTVAVSTGGGTAPSGPSGEYTPLSSTVVTFPAGAATETVNITLINNLLPEAPVAYFNVTLASPTGAILGTQSTSTVNLVSSNSSDTADFITDLYHSLLNGPADATGFVYAYQTVFPGQTVSYATAVSNSLANDGTIFLTSPAYIDLKIQAAFTAFLGGPGQASDLNYWYGQYTYFAGQPATKTTAFEHMLAEIAGSTSSIAHAGNTGSGWLNVAFMGLLGRAPGQADYNYWGPQLNLNQPSTFVTVAYQITQSGEYRQDTVKNLFTTLLGRSPSSSDISYFAGQLATQSRALVGAQIMSSTEFFLDAGNTINGWVNRAYSTLLGYTGDTAGVAYHDTIVLNGFVNQRDAIVNSITASGAYLTGAIQNAFMHILQHAASSAQVSYYLGYLTNHTVEQFRSQLYGTGEYLQNEAQGLDGNWLVGIYQNALGRGITSPEFNYWAGQINSGVSLQSIADKILTSGEYFNDLTNSIVQQLLDRSATGAEIAYYRPLLQAGQTTDAGIIASVAITPGYFNKSPQFP